MMIADDRAGNPAHNPPVLICADLQMEYLMEGRRHLLSGAEAIATTCHEILTFWRSSLCPIVHLKRVAQAAWFNPASNLTDWIQQLKPKPGELAFEHPLPSAYSSARFAEYMTNMKNLRCILLGFSLDETILSTAIDGYHRGHRYQIIKDAVACKNPRDGDATAYRNAVMEVMSNYVTFLKLSDLPAISAETGA
jgi:nicotinamidase-related amidase